MMNIDVSIKLPPLLLRAFCININKAKCIKCNISCASKEEDILFHLSICNGTLIEENIQTAFKFNCLKCYFLTNSIDQWKCHLFKFDHISNSFDSDEMKFSYSCNLCSTHFYGLSESILKHHCKPQFIPSLSHLMAFVYEKCNIMDKHAMLHYCTDCSYFTYDLTELHIKKHREVANTSVCNSCLITFYSSSNEEFLNHKVSFEHMVLWCSNGARSVPKMSTTTFQKLPYYITKYVVISSLLKKFCCIVCNTIDILTYECIYEHFNKCISSKKISETNSCMPLLKVNCNLCDYSCSAVDKNLYKCWVDHVISFDHLSKTVVGKKDKQKLISYYCYVSETVFYGTDSFIKNLILKTNNDIGRLLFVSDLMAKVYNCVTNTHFSCNILFCCGICQNHTDDHSFNCVHKNNDSSLSLYCSTCLVMFNVESDFNEHLLSSEHIILRYFKSNQLGELKILDRSMETMKMYLTNLNKSDDDDDNDDDSDDYNDDNPRDTIRQDNNEIITSTKNITSCDPKENITNLIEKLSAQPIKSAFNNYLRMNFDLLIQKPQASNDIIKSRVFVCDICNLVLRNRDDWIKHDTEHHTKNINPKVLFCNICCIYLVSTYDSIDHHLKTMEHKVMEVFQECPNKNVIKPSLNNTHDCNKNLNPTKDDMGSDFNVEIKKIENSDEYTKNKSIYIEIQNVANNLKKNNYYILNKIILEIYGDFKQVENVNNSFLILFENKDQIKCIREDATKLKDQYGFTLHVIEKYTEKVLSLETIDLFKDWGLLCARILRDLETMDLTLTSAKIQSRIQQLCDSICSLQIVTDLKQIYIFGSRVYGLATNATDIDIYLEIDGTFDGEIANDEDIQVELVKTFAERCLSKPKVFQNVESICHCRVPIVTFYHVPSKLICDVSFKSGLSTYNTKLIKFYLSMDTTVKWLVCVIVKNWALQNGLKDRHLFTSYALIWLVLFYLMTEKVVPSLIELRKNATKDDHKVIEGWDCTFGKCLRNISEAKRPKLLMGFFQYYANKRALKDNVLSTCTGQLIKKQAFYEKFSQLSGLSKIQRTNFKNFKSKVDSNFEKNYGLVLQDPFELSFNLTRNLHKKALTDFCDLCHQSSTLLINMKGYNMFSNT